MYGKKRRPRKYMYVRRVESVNHRLPIQSGRFSHIPRHERLCTLCNSGDIGDEYHYLLVCSHLAETRKKFIPRHYFKYPNVIKFHNLMSSKCKVLLLKLVKFIREIQNCFKR